MIELLVSASVLIVLQAMDCFRASFVQAPWASKDLALVSMGNIMQETGFIADAMALIEMAIHV